MTGCKKRVDAFTKIIEIFYIKILRIEIISACYNSINKNLLFSHKIHSRKFFHNNIKIRGGIFLND